MDKNNLPQGRLTRIETYLDMAQSGREVRLEVTLHKDIIKQSMLTDEADNLRIEKDIYLLMADFRPVGADESAPTVSKVYAFGSINDSQVDAQTVRLIANERIKMDYERLTHKGIVFNPLFFEG